MHSWSHDDCARVCLPVMCHWIDSEKQNAAICRSSTMQHQVLSFVLLFNLGLIVDCCRFLYTVGQLCRHGSNIVAQFPDASATPRQCLEQFLAFYNDPAAVPKVKESALQVCNRVVTCHGHHSQTSCPRTLTLGTLSRCPPLLRARYVNVNPS